MAKKKPKLGELIDQLWTNEQDQKQLTTALETLRKDAATLEVTIMNLLKESGIESAKGENGNVTLKKDTVPAVKDWDKFYAYIVKNKAFELLQKRVGLKAYRERLEEGEVIPGVEAFEKETLSCTTNK